ncbi:MAG: hypothetical protein VKL60_18905 [Sphaerospermopsis sp.]|nr:hypothetical protein [Sphaerospermopsis sp.]
MYIPQKDALLSISRADFKELHSIHWGIECYHRAIKQVCGVGKFMVSQCVGRVPRLEATGEPVRVRTTESIRTHFFRAIRAFTQLELMRAEELIENWYELQRNLSLQVARDFILEHLSQKLIQTA